jgi:hypothetical protein
LRRKALGWGIALVVLAAPVGSYISSQIASITGSRVGTNVLLIIFLVCCGICVLIGGLLLIPGIRGERAAARFNRTDWAIADGLAGALQRLVNAPHGSAYDHQNGAQIIDQGRLVEIERHFDQQTEGAITGSMSHQLRMFGTAFSSGLGHMSRGGTMVSGSLGSFNGSINGLSQVELGLNSTTRSNLMGDALFAVFEAPGQAGERDTYRVISMSQPGVASWISALIHHAADQFGGGATHSGTTMMAWSGNLIGQFQPQDISYVTDRLKAISSRPYEQREPVRIFGTPAGRNALIATTLQIAGGQPLRMMPSRFPELLGSAVAEGVAIGSRTLAGRRQKAAISS